MTLTNFSNGLSSFGVPIFGGGLTVPTMSKTGKAFFVDPVNGSDANRGTDPRNAVATVSQAYSLTTDKAGDVVYLMNDGNTSGTAREDATITWSNDNTHLIGWCAPSMISQRARISPTSGGSSIVTPQLTVSGNGNIFANISLFEGTSEDSVASECVRVTGSRNYFWNVAMMNLGDVTNGHSGDEANSCHLKISAGEENVFERCYIGLDTAVRSTTNANVELVSAAARNIFKDCFFPCFADSATVLFIKVDGADDIDRFVLFERCVFHNADNSTATTMTAAASVNGAPGGYIILKDCLLIGCTDWTSGDNTDVLVSGATWTSAGSDVNVGIPTTVNVS